MGEVSGKANPYDFPPLVRKTVGKQLSLKCFSLWVYYIFTNPKEDFLNFTKGTLGFTAKEIEEFYREVDFTLKKRLLDYKNVYLSSDLSKDYIVSKSTPKNLSFWVDYILASSELQFLNERSSMGFSWDESRIFYREILKNFVEAEESVKPPPSDVLVEKTFIARNLKEKDLDALTDSAFFSLSEEIFIKEEKGSPLTEEQLIEFYWAVEKSPIRDPGNKMEKTLRTTYIGKHTNSEDFSTIYLESVMSCDSLDEFMAAATFLGFSLDHMEEFYWSLRY